MQTKFDITRARIPEKPIFEPYLVTDAGIPLNDVDLADDRELMVIERGGIYRAFLLRELAYHHVAQGKLAHEPYVISF